MNIQHNISLLPHNTFGIDVSAEYFAEYHSENELIEILNSNIAKSNSLLPIGEGSNLLFLSDYKGLILVSKINSITTLEENEETISLEIGSGVKWDDAVSFCVENKYYGIENLSIIPGHTGAAAVQNIGAYGVEIKDCIETVRAVNIADGSVRIFKKEECEYGYRESIFKSKYKGKFIITAVILRLSKKESYCFEYPHLESAVKEKGSLNLTNVRETVINIRNSKLPDPKLWGNAGSYFKNPIISLGKFEELIKDFPTIPHFPAAENQKKISAAWLIDQTGWKGKRIGNVEVWKSQPLVLVNTGKATGKEISELAEKIQQSIKDKFDIEITPEVTYIV